MSGMEGETTVLVGAQWGDEGKGKVGYRLTKGARTMIRCHGGGNTGRTVVVDGKKRALHLMPDGILREGTLNIVGPHVVCDPQVLVEELAIAKEHGARVLLDRRAHVVLPIHKHLDVLREAASGAAAIGTTGQGIGPCMEDVAARRGVALQDLVDPKRLAKALAARNFLIERTLLQEHYCKMLPAEGMDLQRARALAPAREIWSRTEEYVRWAASFADLIRPHLGNAREALADIRNAPFLFELVQGMLLDVEQGTWPYVTSSHTSPAVVWATLGVSRFDRIIGVAKAYVTRVGGGPFPTEAGEADAAWLRERGAEFGTTTGRPRRCGWLDLPALRYACQAGGIREIALTKLDIFTGRDEIPVCLFYKTPDGGEVWVPHDMSAEALAQMTPHFQMLRGWQEPLGDCRHFGDLPQAAKDYVHCITRNLEMPVVAIGVGPDDEQVIGI